MARVASAEMAIRAVAVTKAYESSTAPVQALRDVSVEIRRGERVALLGKSGSGKSTLLNLLGGLDRLSSGNLWVNGQELARLNSDELARYRLTTVGMIFQSYNLIAARTALQNVELPLVFAGIRPPERRRAAHAALAAVGLEQRLHHRPMELSGGESQRVAIARALINHPHILLADEPTGNLDTASAEEVMAYLTAHIDAHGTTLILVTHDEDLARRRADRILHLQDGRLIS